MFTKNEYINSTSKLAELIFISLMFINAVIAIVVLKINTHTAGDIDSMKCTIVETKPIVVKVCTEKVNE